MGNSSAIQNTPTLEELVERDASSLTIPELQALDQFLDNDLLQNKKRIEAADKKAELAAKVEAKKIAWNNFRHGKSSKNVGSSSSGGTSSSSNSISNSSNSIATSGNVYVGGSMLSGADSSRAMRITDPDGRCFVSHVS